MSIGHFHEKWFDEAQAWLIARDSSLWQLFVERIRYEGSPGLWHLILWFAIRAGLPYDQMHLISAMFALAGAAIVLWRAPFPAIARVAVLFSYFFAFQYSVISRSYSVDLFLIPLAATWFSGRSSHPLRYALVVGLIANLNAHGLVAAAVLGVELLWTLVKDRRLLPPQPAAVAAIALVALLGLIAVATAWQPGDNGFVNPALQPRPQDAAFDFIRGAFIDRMMIFGANDLTWIDGWFGFTASVLLLLPSLIIIHRGPAGPLSLAITLSLLSFSAFGYANFWHSGLLQLFWLFMLWSSWNDTIPAKLRGWALACLLALFSWQGIQAVRMGLWDVHNVFSPGREVALAIESYRAGHEDARIFAVGHKTFAAQPWAEANLFDNYYGRAPTPSYVVWAVGAPWKASLRNSEWERSLAAQPDLIVTSLTEVHGHLERLLPEACSAGYGVRALYRGGLPQRSVVREDDSIVLFEKGLARGCSPATQASALQRGG